MPKRILDDDEDEDATPIKKRKAAPAPDVDEDNDDEEDEEETDDSDDDDEDEDAEDEDDDDEPAPKKKKAGGFSWDTDDAEGGGRPEGRIVLMRPRTRLASIAQYENDDPDGVPVLTIDCIPITKANAVEADIFRVHLTAGKAERMVPNSDGTDFEPAEGSKARGLGKGSNTFYFIKSLEDAGFPKDRLRGQGIAAIHGTVCELARVDQPVRRGFAASNTDEEDRGPRTMPSITNIYALPGEKKGKEAVEAAEAALHTKRKTGAKPNTATATAKGPLARKVARGKAADESGRAASIKGKGDGKSATPLTDSDLIDLADKAVQSALTSDKFAKKGIDVDEVYAEAFQYVKAHPQRAKIMALIQSNDYLIDDARPWFYNDKTDRITNAQ